jgi:chemotaxis protein histidine kinase CheA
MRSRQLQTALTEFLDAAGGYLRGEVAGGAEVPFELGSRAARSGPRATPLYCYRALTGVFIAEREAALRRLPAHAEAVKVLEGFGGLDRYLANVRMDASRTKGRARARDALTAILDDVFDEQSDFELRPERLRAAFDRLERAELASPSDVTLVATLHGVMIASAELPLTKGLKIAQRDALEGVPEAAISAAAAGREKHLIVVYGAEEDDARAALLKGGEVLQDLLRSLRLFGDGRVCLGPLAWARVGAGPWTPMALGTGGRTRGMLIVSAEQEDELRAFCNLISRRAPHRNELAWAMRRFELGCEREDPYQALTDHLLALRVLLEPEGPSSGLLAERLAALCATPKQHMAMTERIDQAQALERATIAGTAARDAAGQALAGDVADHLRALLRDVICGHLAPDLVAVSDELLDEAEEAAEKAAEQAAENAAEQAAENAAEQAAENAAEQAAEHAAEQATENAAEEVAEKAAEQATEKAAEEAAEKEGAAEAPPAPLPSA